MRRRGRGALALLLLSLPAGAAHAAPAGAPEPDCHGLAFEDPRGDQVSTAPAVDLLEGWFGYTAGRMTVNLRVAEVPAEPPEGVRSIAYTFGFRIGEILYAVSATVYRGGAVAYQQSFDRPAQGERGEPVHRELATTGRVFAGADGVVRIDLVPDEHLRDGARLEEPAASAWEAHDTGPTAVMSGSDGASGEGPLAVTSCDGTSAMAAAPSPTTSPAQPSPQPVAPRPPERPLAVAVSPTGRLRGRAVTIRMASTGRVSALRARLLRGRRLVARARLTGMGGLATLRLRVPRGTRPGPYTLRLSGVEADGARRALRAAIRLSR